VSLPQPLFWLLEVLGQPRTLVRSPDRRRVIREEAVIERAVRRGVPLPRRTARTSERVVEIPWALTQVPDGAGKVLDVGTAFAPVVHRRLLSRLDVGELHLVDMAPVELNGAVSHTADVRDLPLPTDSFDVTICISTLEHIGMANDAYYSGAGSQPEASGDLAALREMGRVTKPGGRLLVTVPGGREEDHGWFRQYSPDGYRDLVARAGLGADSIECFVHEDGRGWRPASEPELADSRYGVGAPFASGLICSRLSPPPAS
jgi:SAM-dependent methyltransferase